MLNKFFLSFFLIPLILIGCVPSSLTASKKASELVPFTYQLQIKNRLTEDELKKLQYYVSDTITLNREVTSIDPNQIINGKLISKSGKIIDEVIVNALTKGIALGNSKFVIAISFEEGNSFNFGVVDEFDQRAYGLFARSWSGKIGIIDFAGFQYSAINESYKATLLIDAESLNTVVKNRRVLPGIEVPK